MAPTRRYLRLTPHSVLEVRIYLDNPSDAPRWLLRHPNPALPRVLEAVRPLVLPKLKEENEAAKKKGGSKKKGIKDVVVGEDFEVSIFLTELSSPHSILVRRREFKKEEKSGVGGTREEPVEVEDERVTREGSGESVEMGDIPAVREEDSGDGMAGGGEDSLFVSDDEDSPMEKAPAVDTDGGETKEDKKKLMMNTTYDGFRIYGRILCLVVKRKGVVKGKQIVGGAGQAMMEEWIASSQMAQGQMVDE
jgi:hypothetical protein